jgi:hypothetical protein
MRYVPQFKKKKSRSLYTSVLGFQFPRSASFPIGITVFCYVFFFSVETHGNCAAHQDPECFAWCETWPTVNRFVRFTVSVRIAQISRSTRPAFSVADDGELGPLGDETDEADEGANHTITAPHLGRSLNSRYEANCTVSVLPTQRQIALFCSVVSKEVNNRTTYIIYSI